MNTVTLGGTATINDLVSVARFGAKVAFSKEYEERVNHCRAHVDRFSHEGKAIYGLTTGLGNNWKIDWHEDECVNCGKCTKICNFGAFYKDNNRKVHYDADKCWGCTICAPSCPKHAIHLLPREQKA